MRDSTNIIRLPGKITTDQIDGYDGGAASTTPEISSSYATASGVNEDLFIQSGDTYEEAFGKLEKSIDDNELVTAHAISELIQQMRSEGIYIIEVTCDGLGTIEPRCYCTDPSLTYDILSENIHNYAQSYIYLNNETLIPLNSIYNNPSNNHENFVFNTTRLSSNISSTELIIHYESTSTGKYTIEPIVYSLNQEASGEANVIEGVTLNGTAGTITNKIAALTETDPVFTASPAALITSFDLDFWNTDISLEYDGGYVSGDADVALRCNVNSRADYAGVPVAGAYSGVPGLVVVGSGLTLTNGVVSASAASLGLHAVATSGSYDNLSNKPTIPTASISNGTITINGTSITPITSIPDASNSTKGATYLYSSQSSSTSGAYTAEYVENTFMKKSALPTPTVSDAGKILSVDSSGNIVLITPSYVYSGSTSPSSSQGNNGDIYIQS